MLSRWVKIGLVAAVVICIAAALFLTKYFPFSQKSVTESLLEVFPGDLQFEHFQVVYFPHPGCRAFGVTFRSRSRSSETPLVVTAQKLAIKGRWLDLMFRPHRVSRMFLDSLRVHVPVLGHAGEVASQASSADQTPSRITVGEVFADGAVLEVDRSDNKPPLLYDIHDLNLSSVSEKNGFSYTIAMHNAEPPGEIQSTGHIGPFVTGHPGQAPVSGTYTFGGADLAVFDGIAGFLSSNGSFRGSLAKMDVEGETDIPDFEVKSSGHAAPLQTDFRAAVDALNGNVTLDEVKAIYLKTTIAINGTIAHKPGWHGKFTSLDFRVTNGRIQDILQIFTKGHNHPAPMAGTTSFNAHVSVPPEGKTFLKELALDGNFEINDGRFEHPQTRKSVAMFSERARGNKKAGRSPDDADSQEEVTSYFRGHTTLRDGVATLTDVLFTVPGAEARMHGTYNLLNDKIDFHGTVQMQANASDTTTGIKSLFAKALDPFFKKKGGSVVPVRMDGTYEHPRFGLDLGPGKK